MNVGSLWPLAFVLLVPIIVLLYILKQKGEDAVVPSTMLWKHAIKNIQATTPWEKYKHNILMYLQILTILLLAFALMAPYLKKGGRDYLQALLVVDNTGSMRAAYGEDNTRFEEAKLRASSCIDGLSENCAITILTVANAGEIVASNVTDKAQAKALIRALAPTDLPGSVNDCRDLIQSMAGQWENCGVTVFTDTAFEMGELAATVVNLHSAGDNLSLDYVSYGMNEAGTLTVLAKVTNYSALDYVREVNLYGDDALLDVKSVTVPAGGSEIVYFEDISFHGVLLRAEINEKDLLTRDNEAAVVVDSGQGSRVLLVTAGNTFLEKALSSITGLDIYKTTDMSVIGKNESFDLYIFDGVMPETAPDTGNLLYLNPTDGAQVKVTDKLDGVFLSFADSAITDYLADATVGVNEASVLERPVWATAFLTAGESCCGYYGENGVRKIIALGFDFHQSDFPLQAEFPILIYNMIHYGLDTGLSALTACVTGEKVQLYSRGFESDIAVLRPDGEREVMEASLASKVYTNVNQMGLYAVSQKVGDDEYKGYFYSSFPVEAESHTEAAYAMEGAVNTAAAIGGGRELRNYILIILLLLVAAEWVIYVRQY